MTAGLKQHQSLSNHFSIAHMEPAGREEGGVIISTDYPQLIEGLTSLSLGGWALPHNHFLCEQPETLSLLYRETRVGKRQTDRQMIGRN